MSKLNEIIVSQLPIESEVKPCTAYLLDNGDGTHDRYVSDENGNISKLEGGIKSIQAGTNINIDNTDPKNPIISSTFTEVDTLQSVVDRGNITNKQIVFDNKYLDANNVEQSSPTNLGASYNSKANIWFTRGYSREKDDDPTLTAKSNTIFAKDTGGKLTSGSFNTLMGSNAGYSLTTGTYNTFIGSSSGRGATTTSEITGSYNTGIGAATLVKILDGSYNSAFGYYSLNNFTTGAHNTATGTSSGSGTVSGTSNIFIGYSSGGSLGNMSESSKAVRNYNIFIGKQTGILTQGSNNVFIGNESGRISTNNSLSTVNNKLVIHSEVTSLIGNNGTPSALLLKDTLNTGLIIGDFSERWVKFNGRFIINPSYATVDGTYTKQVVAKPDGTLGWTDRTSISANKQRFTGDTVATKTLTQTPKENSVSVILNGIELDEQGGDYTVSGTTVTLANKPLITDVIIIKYLY